MTHAARAEIGWPFVLKPDVSWTGRARERLSRSMSLPAEARR